MTDQELVRRANALAGKFYTLMGHTRADGYRFDRAPHPQERLCWDMACQAYDHINGTDIENALAETDDEPLS